MNYKKLLYSGIAVLLISVLGGLIGTAWSVYGSFNATVMNESAGIGSIGAGIERALIFSIVGVVGSVAGSGMIIYAAIKLRKKP